MSYTTPPGPGGPEFLDSHAGEPVAPSQPGNDNRKRLVVLGGLVGALALGGGAVWAVTSFMSTGAQPAEVLPASTLGYVSVDLDPSGEQKIEAINTLRKFPEFRDKIGLETDDDLREKLFEQITESGSCEGLNYAEDVEPWLGDRAAGGAVDLGGESPVPFVVVQVKDAGGAEAGMDRLIELCGTGAEESGDETGGWVVSGDWIVVSQSEDDAAAIVAATEGGSLADDADFQRWTGEAGDAGILNMYAAPAAGEFLSSALQDLPGLTGSLDTELSGVDGIPLTSTAPTVPPEVESMLADFGGAAATLRFDGGALEFEMATSNYNPDLTTGLLGGDGAELVESLPDDTVAAFGMGLSDGWAQALLDYMATSSGAAGADLDQMLAQAETETGLALPEDLETLLGEGVAVSLGSDIDADAITNGGPQELPLSFKIKGDAAEIQTVLDKVSALAGPEIAPFLEVTEADGYAVLGLNEAYTEAVREGGSLGDSEAYDSVIEDDATSVFFVDFDGGNDWLVNLADDDPEISENLAPLSALGASSWGDDEVLHGVYKITTD